MLDFPNKILTIILVFLMLVVAPITWMYVRDDMISDRIALNEVTQFIDKVTDKAFIDETDIDDLYVGLNASGGTYDVKIIRYMPTPIPTSDGQTRLLYSNVDYYDNDAGKPVTMNKGDLVKVTVEEVGMSPAKRLMWNILKIDSGTSKFSLTGSVR